MGGYSLIEAALKQAGLLAANATEAEVMAAYGQVATRLALGTSGTGEALTQAQVAKQLADGGAFTQRVAQVIRTARSLDPLSNTGKNAVTRLLSPAFREGIRNAAGAAARQGARTAAGTAAAGLSLPAVLGIIAVLGAVGGGIYMAKNWGKPSVEAVKAGPKVADPFVLKDANAKPIGQHDVYHIYAVNTSGWSFYIGRPSDVENRAGNSIADGGTSSQPIQYKKLVDQAFNNSTDATNYLKARVTKGKSSYWTGQWYKFGGDEYRSVHVGL